MNVRYCGASIVTAALLAFVAGCTGEDKEPSVSPCGQGAPGGAMAGMVPAVSVATVKRTPIAQTLQLTGTVEPVRTARLASPVEGPVQTLWVREGDTVKAGTVLLEIGRKGAVDAQLAAAREYLQSSELELERIKKLVADGAIAGSQLDAARARYENARAQHARASEASGDFRIRAPWRGIVSEVLVEEGDFVIPRAQLLHMYDPTKLIVKSSVPETRAQQIRQSAPVQVRFDAYPGRIYGGSVGRVYPRLDPKTRTRTFEITISDTVSLIPGMFARLSVETARSDSALVVPMNALVNTPKGKQVAWLVENKSASARPVITGINAGGLVEIMGGLSAGEVVVVAGNERLRDGMPVRIEGTKSPDGDCVVKTMHPEGKNVNEAAGGQKKEMNNKDVREQCK